MRRRKTYLVLWLGWVALTFVLTSIPNPEFEVPIPWADKLEHVAFYGVMGFFFALWRRESGASLKTAVAQAFLVTALVGGVDEAHQHWIPGRFADVLDWLADAAGGGGGAVFSAVLPRLFPFLVTE
jgi:VanZ family protein